MNSEDFCPQCKSESEDISAGHVLSLNFVGRAFVGSTNRCPHCGSDERKLFFFMLLPVIPLGTWKVRQLGSGRILTRKLSAGSIPDFADHTVTTPEEQRRWHKKLFIGFLVFFVVANVVARLLK